MLNRKIIVLSFILLFGFVVGVYYYKFAVNNHEIVTLLPEEGEIKKKPIDPGGMVIPNSDSLVYEKLKPGNSRKRKINILPGPEEPLEIIQKAIIQTKYLDSIDEILANIEYYESGLNDIDASVDNEDFVMPNTLLTKDDLEDAQSILLPGTKLRIIKAIENRYKISRFNVVDEKQDGYKIQLSSAHSSKDAKKQWQKIKQRHFKVLQDANLVVKRVKGANERIFYLVMAGTYPSLNHAKLLCKKLSTRKQNCIVTK